MTTLREALRAALAEPVQEPVAEWIQIDGYEGRYSVSASGEVRNDTTGRLLKHALAGKGYSFVSLWKGGKGKHFYIHRLVAAAFLPREDGQNEVNHIDGNKLKNDVSNLEWCTRSDNTRHARHVLNLPSGGMPPRRVVAIDCVTGEKTVYPSIEAAARSGYASAHIYRCLTETHRSHKGKKWVREDAHPAPQRQTELHPVTGEQLPTTTAGWLHYVTDRTSAAWQEGYERGLKREGQRQPLTEYEAWEIWDALADRGKKGEDIVHAFARAIERAHGIGGQDEVQS